MSVRIKPVTIAPMEMRLLGGFGTQREKRITVADSNGRNKISQGKSSCFIRSKFHARQIFDVRGLAFAVERHDQRETDRHFRRRHGDDEEHQHLAVELVVEP